MGEQIAYSWMEDQGSATTFNPPKMKWCNIPMDGATDRATVGATDRLIEIESTHYLLHHGDGGFLRNARCLKSVYHHIISL